MYRLLVALFLSVLPTIAWADPYSLLYFVASIAAYNAWYWVAAAIIITATWSSYSENTRKLKHQREDAIREYNANLKDIGQIQITVDPDIRDIYGTKTVSGYVIFGCSSDKTARRGDGTSYTRKDAYKHLVIVIGRGPIQSYDDFFIDGKSIGTLDSNGWVTSGIYTNGISNTADVTLDSSGNYYITGAPATSVVFAQSGSVDNVYDQTGSVTLLSGGMQISGVPNSQVTYTYSSTQAYIRIRKYLGSDTQVADTELITDSGGKWTVNHKGLGWAYIILTLDLEYEPFQRGIPQLTMTVKGKNVYDPRLDSTNSGTGSHRYSTPSTWTWSNNPSLITTAYLMSDIGFSVNPATQVDWPTVVIAANDSDVSEFATYAGSTTVSGTISRYACDAVFTSSDSIENSLQAALDSMAGFAVYSAQWSLYSGTWRTPIETFNDSDLDGEISITQMGSRIDDIFNGVNISIVKLGESNPADITPYQNATFIAADGENLWTDMTLPYTNDTWRATQIARIKMEQARLSLIIQYPAKMHKWRRRVGERIYVNSTEYGYVNKPFIIADWAFGITSAVVFTLHEDESTIYDILDSVTVLSANPSSLPNPAIVDAITGLTAVTGSTHAGVDPTGAVYAPIIVTWNSITDRYAYSGGHIEINWRNTLSGVNQSMRFPPETVKMVIDNIPVGTGLVISARVWNGFKYSSAVYYGIQSLGPGGSFEAVTGLSATQVNQTIVISFTQPVSNSWTRSEVRTGSSWATGTTIINAKGAKFAWAPTNTAATYNFWVKHFDSSNRETFAAATTSLTYAAVSLGGFPVYRSDTDPATVGTVVDGSTWVTITNSRAYLRISSSWVPMLGLIDTNNLVDEAATSILLSRATSLLLTFTTEVGGSAVGNTVTYTNTSGVARKVQLEWSGNYYVLDGTISKTWTLQVRYTLNGTTTAFDLPTPTWTSIAQVPMAKVEQLVVPDTQTLSMDFSVIATDNAGTTSVCQGGWLETVSRMSVIKK
jgi:hypothetical protein